MEKFFLKSSIAGLMLFPAMGSQAGNNRTDNTESAPNILFFLVDDMGWMDIGANGSEFYETPNIDRLAQEGVRFERAYAGAPVSSPTRASILTGQAPARVGITQFIGTGFTDPDYVRNLPHENICFPELLKEQGYTNIYLGKWHLNDKNHEKECWPEAHGFDINLAGHWRGGLYIPNKYHSPWNFPNLENGPKGEYITHRLTQEALNFIDTIGSRPFLLYFSFYNVHAPQDAPMDLIQKYKAKAQKLNLTEEERTGYETIRGREVKYRKRQDHPVYAAQVESVDIAVGKVLEELKAKGLDKNTVVIFASDNGGLSTAEGNPTSNCPLRMGKGWIYEGGLRVPTIIRWPGVARPGYVVSTSITSMDFYPTILDAAGIKTPANYILDGKSLRPLLEGKNKGIHDDIFFHYPYISNNQKGRPASAVIRGDYKMIVYLEDGKKELYNLKKDIGETRNLYQDNKLTASMFKSLENWWKEVGARFPKKSVFNALNPD